MKTKPSHENEIEDYLVLHVFMPRFFHAAIEKEVTSKGSVKDGNVFVPSVPELFALVWNSVSNSGNMYQTG